ncbi:MULTISPECIES: envelope stress response membrane protein PspB [Sphingomonas]|uniref:envelope stress response membrane protein PspB n=1 Tax=Sphingomonas TaxID=13687 RepID=UPI000834AA0E|nr:envelope stress response membrane protein PspB [Sphingomonas sp. CCH10-B3]
MHDEILVPIIVVGMLFIGLPWIVLHYVTKWRQAPKITDEDERLLDELYLLARRLDDRLGTIERIVAADHPDWRPSVPLADAPAYDITRRN